MNSKKKFNFAKLGQASAVLASLALPTIISGLTADASPTPKKPITTPTPTPSTLRPRSFSTGSIKSSSNPLGLAKSKSSPSLTGSSQFSTKTTTKPTTEPSVTKMHQVAKDIQGTSTTSTTPDTTDNGSQQKNLYNPNTTIWNLVKDDPDSDKFKSYKDDPTEYPLNDIRYATEANIGEPTFPNLPLQWALERYFGFRD